MNELIGYDYILLWYNMADVIILVNSPLHMLILDTVTATFTLYEDTRHIFICCCEQIRV
jgi:hypothetical protein